MRYLILGDIHGAFANADDLIQHVRSTQQIDAIIQVGDMGFGFPGLRAWQTEYEIPTIWIDGNHDNHDLLGMRHEHMFGFDPYHSPTHWWDFHQRWDYKERGSFENGILFIGGASSIDKRYRTEGLDWWAGENISYEDEGRVLATIERVGAENIHTVISHDAPAGFSMLDALQGVQGPSAQEFRDSNRMFLEHVRTEVLPERWYFGHYHVAWKGELDGCQWRCIDMIRGARGRSPEKEDYVVVELP